MQTNAFSATHNWRGSKMVKGLKNMSFFQSAPAAIVMKWHQSAKWFRQTADGWGQLAINNNFGLLWASRWHVLSSLHEDGFCRIQQNAGHYWTPKYKRSRFLWHLQSGSPTAWESKYHVSIRRNVIINFFRSMNVRIGYSNCVTRSQTIACTDLQYDYTHIVERALTAACGEAVWLALVRNVAATDCHQCLHKAAVAGWTVLNQTRFLPATGNCSDCSSHAIMHNLSEIRATASAA